MLNKNIRLAKEKDIPYLNKLLFQVENVHHFARPDLFKKDAKKYTDDDLKNILLNEETPIFVYEKGNEILGYCFCIIKTITDSNVFQPIKTLYIDDLCVNEENRGQHIGKSLYDFALEYAKKIHCYNVTLNVWADNEKALEFYKKIGLHIQKIGMEKIL